MTPVESLIRELAEVQDLLVSLPDDAFAERTVLINRRRTLQAEADLHAAGVDWERTPEDLCLELAHLRAMEASSKTERRRREARISHIKDVLAERSSHSD